MNFYIKLSISIFVFTQCFSQESTPQYINFYSERNNAIYDIEMMGDYQSAFNHYKAILKLNKKNYFKDLIRITECAIVLKKDSSEVSNYIGKSFNQGVPLLELNQSGIIYEYLESNPQLNILRNEDSLLKNYYSDIHYELFSKINYLKAQDDLLRPYWKDSIARKIMLETYLKNLDKLKETITKHGFPGINKVGYLYVDVDIILIHGISSLKDTAKFSKWNEILRRELFAFNILPSHYAIYIDTYYFRNFNEQIYGTLFTTINGNKIFLPIRNITEIDSIRKNIGLCHYRIFLKC
jgi:hypothetical protein